MKLKQIFFDVSTILIYLIIATIPLTHKELFAVYDPDLVWSKFVLTVIAGVGLIYFIRKYNSYKRDTLFLFLFGIIAFQFLSLTVTRDVASSMRMIIFQASILFAYPVFKEYLKSKSGSIFKLTNLYLAIFFLVFLFWIYQVYLQSKFGVAIGGVWPVPGYPARYGSTFWDVNHFGIYLSSLIFMLTGVAVARRSERRIFLLYIAGIILALVALYFTSSRSSMIGFAVSLLICAGLYAKSLGKRLHNINYWYIGGFGVIPVLAFMWVFAQKLHDMFLYRAVSFFSHLYLLKVGISIGLQNFLLGIGTNSFYAYFKDSKWADVYYYIDAAALNFKLPLHNLWLESFTETGVFAFIFFTCFWIVLLYSLYMIFRRDNDYVALGLLGGVLSFLVAGLMYSYKSEFFWIYVVIAASYSMTRHKFQMRELIDRFSGADKLALYKLVLATAGLIIPIFYITNTLMHRELYVLSAPISTNVAIHFYQTLLNLFIFIFGNYSFSGRLLSLILYSGTVSILIGFLKRGRSFVDAVAYTSIIVNVVAVSRMVVEVSANWYFSFGFIALVVLIGIVVKQPNFCVTKVRFKHSSVILLASLVIFVGLANYAAMRSFRFDSYDSNLSFLLELATNRGLFARSDVYITDVPDRLAHYYCDQKTWNSGTTDVIRCTIMDFDPGNIGTDIVVHKKTVIVAPTASADYRAWMDRTFPPFFDITILSAEDYSLFVIEPKLPNIPSQ